MDQSLKDATLGATNIQAPTSALGASNAPELAALYRSSFQLPQSSGAVNAQANIASQQVAEAKAAASAAAQKKKDLSNINNYKIVKKGDGGYDFFDPDGHQVDIATLAQTTGTKASDILKDSENPIDIQYVNDYQNLQSLLNAVVSKDTGTMEKYKQAFTDSGLPDVTQQKPQDIIDQFKSYYQRYYTPRTVNKEAWGVTPNSNPFVPSASASVDARPGD